MKAPLLFFLAVLLASSSASASWLPAPFNILDEKFYDGDWSVADKHGKPIKNVQSSGHIRAWIDIIGFRNESTIDGRRYVNGSARDFAIVKRNAWHTPVSGVVVSFTSTYCINDTYNTTTATQHTSFHWKKKIYTMFGSYWKHYHESLTVSHTVESPETFDNSISDYEVMITSYNNSVTPYTIIYAPSRWNIIKQSVHYKNDTASWHNLTGIVKKNNRGTEHVRFINETGFAIDENETITRRAEYFVINEAPLNWSLLNISVFTPYIVKNDSICNATIYNSKPSDFVAWDPIIIVLGILSSFMIGIGIVLRRA